MAEGTENMKVEINTGKIKAAIIKTVTADNVQKYVLGSKKNGSPRSLYDIYKDHVFGKNNKNKNKKKAQTLSLYFGKSRKKKDKDKGSKYWRYDD